jgi:hypothetical protein
MLKPAELVGTVVYDGVHNHEPRPGPYSDHARRGGDQLRGYATRCDRAGQDDGHRVHRARGGDEHNGTILRRAPRTRLPFVQPPFLLRNT